MADPDPATEGERRARSASRRRGREVALQVLYAIDLSRGRPRVVPPEQTEEEPPADWVPVTMPVEVADPPAAFEAVAAHFEMPPGARSFARELSLAVCERLEPVDEAIKRHARNWRIERMAVVDRNILRLGTYELCFTDTPAPVILNEAVDLARRFGSDPSPAFVNGILDAVATEIRERAS